MNKKQLEERLLDTKKRILEAITTLQLDQAESELDLLEEQSKDERFWQDRDNSSQVLAKITKIKEMVSPWRKLEAEAQSLIELVEATAEGDSILASVEVDFDKLEAELGKIEDEIYLSGKYDRQDAILSVYAGAGGVDAQDWAEMLLTMFLKYGQSIGLATKVIGRSEGQEAGIKSASVELSGPFAYGLLRSEAGVHRLVRISPYDSDKARHTSFALVEVIPVLTENDFKLDESELKIDTYRASGHGGQSVNTTDSAVRVTHTPTGTVVTYQNERSQLQNKEQALRILKARLLALHEAEKAKELKVIRGENMSAEWGSQIRSYVLHPYQMVKDHRTNYETSDTKGVLEGNLTPFVQTYLKKTAKS